MLRILESGKRLCTQASPTLVPWLNTGYTAFLPCESGACTSHPPQLHARTAQARESELGGEGVPLLSYLRAHTHAALEKRPRGKFTGAVAVWVD